VGPRKPVSLQGKGLGVQPSTVPWKSPISRGAARRHRQARFFEHRDHEFCLHHGRASRGGGAGQRGPRSPSWPPSWFPKKPPVCREKSCRVRGSVPFGGSNGLVCLFFTRERRTATTGAWPSTTAAATDRHHGERHWAGNADAFLLRTTLLNITTPRRGTIRDRNQPRMALSTVTTFAYSRGTGVRRRCAAWLEQDLERELRRAAATQHVASLLEIGVGGGELCRFGLVEA
jgi:hypothetical protein